MALRVHINPEQLPRYVRILPPAPHDGEPKRFGIPPRRLRPEGTLPPLVIDLISRVPTNDEVRRWLNGGSFPGLRADASDVLRAANRSIDIHIDSIGGDGEAAAEMTLALLAHQWRVRARIVGACASCAPKIALAADEVVIAPRARVTFHRPFVLMSLAQYEAHRDAPQEVQEGMEERLRELDAFAVDLIATRMNVTHQAAREMLTAQRTWTAAEAVAVGFADRLELAKAA